MNWFKFYGQDWLTDPKVVGLRPEDRLCFLSLLCLASAASEPGVINNITESQLLRITQLDFDATDDNCPWRRAEGVLIRLEELKMIRYESNTNRVTVVNYVKRQTKNLSNEERQALFRLRQKETKTRIKSDKKSVTKVTLDKSRVDKNRIDKSNIIPAPDGAGGDIAGQIIDRFKTVNPAYRNLFKRKNQREATKRMLDQIGYNQLEKIIAILPKTNTHPYMPTITTPIQLEERMGALQSALLREKNKNPGMVEIS